MDIQQDLSFDEWFDIFKSTCLLEHGYQGPIDKYTFEWNYEEGETPEYAAANFIQEMRE